MEMGLTIPLEPSLRCISIGYPFLNDLYHKRPATARLADAWPVLQRPTLGYKGSVYITGQSESCFVTNNGFATWVAFASKKDGQSQKTSDLDNEKDLVTEADLQYKPLGFGQGKAYDTSLEDKLLEELEREEAGKKVAAQKQKNNVTSTNSSKVKSTSERPTTVDGIKVWVGDLPKKKNVDRDLRSAFRHIPGLLDIAPSVLGNEKTRDPICKGFGFMTFDTVDHAKSFISSFQGRPITFGKVEKKVVFRLVKANDGEVVPSGLAEVGRLRIRDKEAGKVVCSYSNSELVSAKSVGQNVLAADNLQDAGVYQPQVEVIEYGEAVELHEETYSEEEDSGDEFDSDDEPEFEISVELGELSQESAPRDWPQGAENNNKSDAEKRIEELERRLLKKLEDGCNEAQKGKREEITLKARGFTSKKTKASKHSSPKGNNMAAVTHGLKKTEREFMTGVLEKYGKSPSITKP